MRFLRNQEVAEKVGVSRQTIWRWQARGFFPPTRRLASNVSGLFEHEVDEWLRENAVPVGAGNADADPAGE